MSIEKKLQQAFQQGEKLTVLEALYKYGTYELKHYVSLLKRSGMDIASEWKSGDGKRWKLYWMNKPSGTV